VPQITRSWLAFLALGAGVVLLALAPGLGTPVAAVSVGLGLFEFGWGAAVLYANRLVVPRIMRAVALAAPIGWTAILVAALIGRGSGSESALGVYPMAVVTVFNLILVAALSRQIVEERAKENPVTEDPAEHATSQPSPARPVRSIGPVFYLTALMLGGVAVSAVTTPAIAATQAGIVNVHSNHGTTQELNLPEHDGH